MEYKSTMSSPYVYMGISRITGEFYIGSRWVNFKHFNRVSSDDLGIEYFTSAPKVAARFSEFDWFIVAEFIDKASGCKDAYGFEQQLIFENWSDPKLLNKHHQHGGKGQWKQIDRTFTEKELNNLRKYQKELWATLTVEEKRERKEKQLESARNRSIVRQLEVSKTLSETKKKMHQNRTPSQKAASKAKEKATWNAKTIEEMQEFSNRIKESLAKRTVEEEAIRIDKLRQAAILQNQNMSVSQKKESIRKQLETKANKSLEEKEAYSQKLKDVASNRTPAQKAAIKAKELETRRLNKLRKKEEIND